MWKGCGGSVVNSRPNGCFTFGRDYWTVEGNRREHACQEVVGYGWLLEPWCTAGAVEIVSDNARLWKVLHKGTAAEANNPSDYYDFEVAVVKGKYVVKVKMGDREYPPWQHMVFENEGAGVYEVLPGG